MSLLRLSALLLASDPTTFTLNIDEKERRALYATAETLLGFESPKKEEVASGLFFGHGDIHGVTCENICWLMQLLEVIRFEYEDSRLLEIINEHRNFSPEREPTPIPEEHIPREDVQPAIVEEAVISPADVEPPPLAPDGVAAVSSGGSFHFMQESELEGASFEHGAEWVERPQDSHETVVIAPEVEAPAGLTVIDTGVPLDVNGVPKHLDEVIATSWLRSNEF